MSIPRLRARPIAFLGYLTTAVALSHCADVDEVEESEDVTDSVSESADDDKYAPNGSVLYTRFRSDFIEALPDTLEHRAKLGSRSGFTATPGDDMDWERNYLGDVGGTFLAASPSVTMTDHTGRSFNFTAVCDGRTREFEYSSVHRGFRIPVSVEYECRRRTGEDACDMLVGCTKDLSRAPMFCTF